MHILFRVAVAAAIACAAACAPDYRQPLEGDPAATVVFHPPATGQTELFFADGYRCDGLKIAASASGGQAQTLRLTPNRRTWVMSRYSQPSYNGRLYCWNVLSFDPAAGQTYDVTTRWASDFCGLSLTDPSGREPRDVVHQEVPPRCQR